MEKSLTELDSSEIEQLTDPCNTTTQLLMAHFVALHLMTRPICCRERKTHTVTMYGIRMDTWIGDILNQMKPEYQANLQWPLFVSQLHTVKRLESYTLVPEMQTDKAPWNGCQRTRSESQYTCLLHSTLKSAKGHDAPSSGKPSCHLRDFRRKALIRENSVPRFF